MKVKNKGKHLTRKSIILILLIILGLGTYLVTQTDIDIIKQVIQKETPHADEITHIGTVEQLKKFRDSVNAGNKYEGKTVYLDANLDLANQENWTPIGNETNPFSGTFDGQNHAISNLTIDSQEKYVGFFGYVSAEYNTNTTCEIKNLGIVNSHITGSRNVGAIVGFSNPMRDINSPVCISNCFVLRSDISSDNVVGGIIGSATTMTTISKCYTDDKTTVHANGNGNGYAGGIIGFIEYPRGGRNTPIISYCFNRSTVNNETKTTGTGGICGYMNIEGIGNGSNIVYLQYCYNVGNVNDKSENTNNKKAILGQLGRGLDPKLCGAVDNIYYLNDIGVTDASAVGKDSDYMQKDQFITDLGGSEVWKFAPETGYLYPVFVGQDTTPPTTSVKREPDSWTKENVTVTVTASDSGVGLDPTAYKFDNNDWQVSNTKQYETNKSNIQIQVKDALGNIATNTAKIDNIDKANPTDTKPNLSLQSATVIQATNQQIDQGTEGANASGIKVIQYAIKATNNNTWGEWEGTDASITHTFSGLSDNTSYDVKTKTTDNAGNSQESKVATITTDKSDKTPPVVTAYPQTQTQYTKSITVQITISEPVQETKLKYAWSTDQNTQPNFWSETTITNKKNASVTGSGMTGTYYLWVAPVTDTHDNASTATKFGPYLLDVIEPKFKVTRNPDGWTNGSVTLEINNIVETGKLAQNPYKFGSDSWQSSTTKVYEQNVGEIDVQVKDEAENIGKFRINVGNIDKTEPKINSLTRSLDSWTKDKVTITGKAQDNESGINGWKFTQSQTESYNSGNWTNVLNPTASTVITGTKEVTENGTWYFHVKDQAGNVKSQKIDITNIEEASDVTAPTITGTVDSANYVSGTWTNKNVKLTISDGNTKSGFEKYIYSTDNGQTWKDYTNAGITFDRETATNVIARTVSKTNLQSVNSSVFTVNIDKTAPTISGITEGAWYSTKTQVVQAIEAGGSDFETNALRWKISSSTITSNPNIDDMQKGGTLRSGNKNISADLTQEGYYVVAAVDRAGNVSSFVKFGIDRTAPTFNVTENTNTWTKNNVTLTINASDEISGVSTTKGYSFDDVWQDTNSKTFEINKEVQIKVKDNAGNESTINTQDINKIDKVAPNTTKPDVSKTTHSITVTNKQVDQATQGGNPSGIAKIEYSIMKVSENSWGEWIDGKTSTSYTFDKLTHNTQYKVRTRVTDNAQNSSISSEETVTTTTLVAGSLNFKLGNASGETYNSGNWTNQNVYVILNNGTPNTSDITTNYSSVDSSAQTITNQATPTTISTEGITKLKVKTTDGTNTVYSTEEYIVKIDKTAPTFELEVESTDLAITARIKNIQEDDSGLLSEGRYKYYIGTSTNEYKLAESTEEQTYIFTDGIVEGTTYYIKVEITDKAGNTGIALAQTTTKIYVSSVEVEPKLASVEVGKTLQLTGKIIPENASNQELKWSSENEEIAKVGDNGEVLGIKEGTVTITVTGERGKQATSTIVVVPRKLDSDSKLELSDEIWKEEKATVTATKNKDNYKVEYTTEGKNGPWQILEGNTIEGLLHGQTVYARLTDGEYHTQPVSKKIIDDERPSLEVTGNIDNWQRGVVTLNIKCNDNKSGLDKVTVNGKQIGMQGSEGTYRTTENGNYQIIAKDKAGNTTILEEQISYIDNAKPSIKVNKSTELPTKENVTLYMNISDTRKWDKNSKSKWK